MSDAIEVKAARIPDRDRLLEALRDEGLDAEARGELEIVVPLGESDGELYHHVEGVVRSVGAPFVPIEHEGVIYIRPPVG
jgi:hypothetical protein